MNKLFAIGVASAQAYYDYGYAESYYNYDGYSQDAYVDGYTSYYENYGAQDAYVDGYTSYYSYGSYADDYADGSYYDYMDYEYIPEEAYYAQYVPEEAYYAYYAETYWFINWVSLWHSFLEDQIDSIGTNFWWTRK